MELRIDLREANQHFSRYVEAVEGGGVVIIMRRGTPVARLVPEPVVRELTAGQVRARERSRERLARGYPLGLERFDRESAHER